jgi:hypothetical protein
MTKIALSQLPVFLTLLILVAACGIPGLAPGVRQGFTEAPASPGSLAGEYYMGDGLGVSIVFNLNPDSTYSSVWHGCLGKYGDWAGSWDVTDTFLVLTPDTVAGVAADDLRSFIIQRYKGNWILVPTDERDQELYHKIGVSRISCFQKSDVVFPKLDN